jgi:hypothetical protein
VRDQFVRSLLGALLGVSVKRSMSDPLQNVRQSRADGAKPDGMIVGRENVSLRHAGF